MPTPWGMSAMWRPTWGVLVLLSSLALLASAAITFPATGADSRHRLRSGDSATVVGRVRGNGEYLSTIRVAAFSAEQGRNDWPAAETYTDDAGVFRLVLPAGSYRLMADGRDWGLPVQWWRAARSFAGARLVTVAAGGTAVGVTFTISDQPSFPRRPPGRIKVPRRPAWLRGLPVDPVEGYQGQVRCKRKSRKGTRALAGLLEDTYGSDDGIGLNRDCVKGSRSEHYDGRAIDWMVNSRILDQARKGDALTRWLTRAKGKEAGVMARRLGVMYVIWRGRVWEQYDAGAGWQTYLTCDRRKYTRARWDSTCHRNHVHISLTFRGARMLTSWWTGQAAS